ncbi:MAG: DUF1573 domain-containing protein [Phycisphaerae bacterium]|jgi:hypothetical protein
MKRSVVFKIVAAYALTVGAAWGQEPPKSEAPAAQPPAPQPAASSPAAAPASAAKLTIEPAEWNFGVKWYGEEAAADVVLKNEGAGPLTIKNVRSSCGCTVAKPATGSWTGKVLQPGESETMKVTYNTRKAARKVSQTITIESDDPTNPRYAFKVEGEVKQAFDVKPQDRVVFASIERDTVATETLELTNNMDQPIALKLKGDLSKSAFDVKLEEQEAGKRYKVSVTTKPPLKTGPNSATIELETGLEKNPLISIPVSAYIAPRVAVSPPKLFVSPKVTQPFQRVIRVTHKADSKLEIKEVKSSHPKITAEVLPPNANANPTRQMQFIEIRVNLPAGNEFPAEGAKIEIFTNDPDPEYQKLTVDVALRDLTAGRAPASAASPATGIKKDEEPGKEPPKKDPGHP